VASQPTDDVSAVVAHLEHRVGCRPWSSTSTVMLIVAGDTATAVVYAARMLSYLTSFARVTALARVAVALFTASSRPKLP